MGPREQAYSSKVRFSQVRMSRAANFLNQEFTYLTCIVENDGDRTIRQGQIVIEFRSADGRIALADERPLLPPHASPILAGQEREVEFSWEKLPEDWNREYPSLRIVGLLLD